ncbi:MAG: hypothetical protein D6776_09070 [Planctomycetota bacterium]|nr:MAG: hypothetical protein D6776_09070 [Planctomycetota bacterium]
MSSPSVKATQPRSARRVQPRNEGTRPHESGARDKLAGRPQPHAIHGQLVYADGENAGKPIERAKYQVLDGSGKVIAEGETGFDGMVHRPVPGPGDYTVRVFT